MNYNPQVSPGNPYRGTLFKDSSHPFHGSANMTERKDNQGTRLPRSVIFFKRSRLSNHPTEKPVELMEYLVKTYTQEGDTVLDFCMGSGTTGVACMNIDRNFIGIEKESEYFDIAERRMRYRQPEFAGK
jgi:site-specific DNA-methyltransferase (adenine-specific)